MRTREARHARRWTWRLKWAATISCAMILIACLPWRAGYDGKLFNITAGGANFFLSFQHTPYPKNPVILEDIGWYFWTIPWSDYLLADLGYGNLFTRYVAHVAINDTYQYFNLVSVLWAPLFLTAILTIVLWRRDRMLRLRLIGCCDRCGYNLTGNTSGACPECGKST